MRFTSLIGIIMFLHFHASSQSLVAAMTNDIEIDSKSRSIFLVLTAKPTEKEKSTLEYFLLDDDAGRNLIHDVLFADGESLYIGIAEKEKFPGKNANFISAPIDTAKLTSHLKRKTIQLYMDSLVVSLSSTTSLTSVRGKSTLVMLNVDVIRHERKLSRNRSADKIVIKPFKKDLYIVQVNKNILRGGPRFKRTNLTQRN